MSASRHIIPSPRATIISYYEKLRKVFRGWTPFRRNNDQWKNNILIIQARERTSIGLVLWCNTRDMKSIACNSSKWNWSLNVAKSEWKMLMCTEGGRIAEVVARRGRWKAKALIISTCVCSIACTYTRVNPYAGELTHTRLLHSHARGTYVHTPCVLRTHKPRLWVSVNSNR